MDEWLIVLFLGLVWWSALIAYVIARWIKKRSEPWDDD